MIDDNPGNFFLSPDRYFFVLSKKKKYKTPPDIVSLKMYGGGTPRLVNLAARGDANRKHHYGWSGAVDNPEMCSNG